MKKSKVEINLTTEERQKLEEITQTDKATFREVQRARLILLASEGMENKRISQKIGLSRWMVIQWRQRFAKDRLEGLKDTPRSGKKPRYNQETERRILSLLDNDPPAGYTNWNGNLMARQLGDVSHDQVWRVLRKHSIHLQSRHSWCISTDTEFTQKAADIAGLDLEFTQNECSYQRG
jgi:transposase